MHESDEIQEVWDETSEQERAEDEQRRRIEQLQIFGHRLQRLADEQVKAKADIEQRWLDDLRAYHGKYDDQTIQRIKQNEGSEIYVNVTRHKCNTAESRLIDLLFPADDKNWTIQSTPVPELEEAAKSEHVVTDESGQPLPVAELAKQRIQEANRKAKAMEREIEDQLIQAGYPAKCRDAIHDAVIFGTGIIKAPVVIGKVKKRWEVLEDGTSVLQIEESLEPTVEVVSPWDYFPDMSARNKHEVEFEFERKLLTKSQVKELLKLPNVLHEQVLEVIRDSEAELVQNDRFAEARTIAGDSINTTRNRFTLWEYHGEISSEELDAVGIEHDGLGMNGTVWILEGKVIRVSLNPLETEESPYSVFNWEVDANSIFGFGIPYLIRSPQSMLNAATRMMMDNAKLSVAPQIIMNRKAVTPADGKWTFAPFKRWYVNDEKIPVNQAMMFVNVQSNQVELNNIYQMARFLVDEQSSIPAIATGEGDPNAAPQTATGVSIQSGAAKVVFKRVVKNFDDDLTIPTIKRFYDWNMQNSTKQEIKGDMQINAIGSTSLLIKEQEAALMSEVLKMIPPEEVQMRIKPEEAIREFFKSRNINASALLKNDAEIDEDIQKAQERAQGQQPPPELMRLQLQAQIEAQKAQQKEAELQLAMQKLQLEAQHKEQQLAMQYEIEMSKLAAEQNKTVEQIKKESGAVELKVQLEQQRLQNQRDLKEMEIATQKQIAALKAQQEANKQALQQANLVAGYDTF